MSELEVNNICEMYLESSNKVAKCFKKLYKLKFEVKNASRRQKDLLYVTQEELYTRIREEIEKVVELRRNLTLDQKSKFDSFVSKRAKININNPDNDFARQVITAIEQDDAQTKLKRK